MRFYTPGQMYRLARLYVKKRINRDPEGKHCPDCYMRGVSDTCAQEACPCHQSLSVVAQENVSVKAIFGKLPN